MFSIHRDNKYLFINLFIYLEDKFLVRQLMNGKTKEASKTKHEWHEFGERKGFLLVLVLIQLPNQGKQCNQRINDAFHRCWQGQYIIPKEILINLNWLTSLAIRYFTHLFHGFVVAGSATPLLRMELLISLNLYSSKTHLGPTDKIDTLVLVVVFSSQNYRLFVGVRFL